MKKKSEYTEEEQRIIDEAMRLTGSVYIGPYPRILTKEELFSEEFLKEIDPKMVEAIYNNYRDFMRIKYSEFNKKS